MSFEDFSDFDDLGNEPDASWDEADPRDAHEEDRMLIELRSWARERGLDGAQQELLRDALLGAFDRAA